MTSARRTSGGHARDSAPLAVIRADASVTIGAGHIVRCAALAERLERLGWRVAFAVREAGRQTLDMVTGSGERLTLACSAGDEPAWIGRTLGRRANLLIVDHYERGRAFESASRDWAERVLVIDDLAARSHDCDVLVDPTPSRGAGEFGGLVPDHAAIRTGPAYAPMRCAFPALRLKTPSGTTGRDGLRILVALGGNAQATALLAVLDGIDQSGVATHVDIPLLSTAPGLDAALRRTETMKPSVAIHIDAGADEVAALTADADLAVGACGSAAWERCCLGLPTLGVVLAENQRDVARSLQATGAIELLAGIGSQDVAEAVGRLAVDTARRAAMGRAAASLCDGMGAARIVAELDVRPAARSGDPVVVRPATAADSDVMFDWQQQPSTRRYARDPRVPGRADHEAWLSAKLADPRSLLMIAEVGGRPSGVLRLDTEDGGSSFEVSIYMAPDHYGKGIGTAALAFARRLVPDAQLRAWVRPENAASLALFRRAGYVSSEGNWLTSAPLPRAGVPA